jgi:hypothetical protein
LLQRVGDIHIWAYSLVAKDHFLEQPLFIDSSQHWPTLIHEFFKSTQTASWPAGFGNNTTGALQNLGQ